MIPSTMGTMAIVRMPVTSEAIANPSVPADGGAP